MPFNSQNVFVRGNVIDPNIVAITDVPPVEPIPHGSSFIVTAPGEWGFDCHMINVVPGDIIGWNNLTNSFHRVATMHPGQRYIVGGASDIYGTSVEDFQHRVIRFNGGPYDQLSSYDIVDGDPPYHGTSIKVFSYHSLFNQIEFRFDMISGMWKYQHFANDLEGPGYDPNHVICTGNDITNFADLEDVEITDPTNGQVIVFEDGKYVNKELDDLDPTTIKMIADNSIAKGDFVFASADDHCAPGIANSLSKMRVIGVATGTVNVGATVVVRDKGEVSLYSGLIPGKRYYLSTTQPGKITDIPPTDEGLFIVPVGIATSDTELAIGILSPIEL